ncbi:MAG: murein hydrolase activator EnvC family protein [Acidimicrobiales bacterium]
MTIPLLGRALAALVAPAAAAAALVTPGAAQSPPPPHPYRPPVEAPVRDWYRAPASPFGPGNRGLEFVTVPGSLVRAIGAGVVVFAGQVGGRLHVTVRHADGLRSTYSFLAELAVSAGQAVAGGQPVGRSGAALHLGVRDAAGYRDPAPLVFGRARVRLAPLPARQRAEPSPDPG